MRRATAYRKEQYWAEAAQGFTNCVNECNALLKLNQERQAAKKSKDEAESARKRAAEAEASHYVEKLWNEANASLKKANDMFGEMAFAAAATNYATAAKQFERCIGAAKAKREEEVKAKEKAEQEKPKCDEADAKDKAEREHVLFKAGHKGIQLWEGGPYWAETNVGAEKPEDYGYYFWWGDTMGYKRDGNTWVASNGSRTSFSFLERNTPTHDISCDVLKKEGWIMAEGVLAPDRDAARMQWGGGWRMPTEREFDDLKSKCDWQWTTVNGVNGYVVHGRGNYASVSIFLPCAGNGYGTSLCDAGLNGYYWSSVPYSSLVFNSSCSGNYGSWSLDFNSSRHGTSDYYRNYGQSVRPVQVFAK